jgi:hypothetical protein
LGRLTHQATSLPRTRPIPGSRIPLSSKQLPNPARFPGCPVKQACSTDPQLIPRTDPKGAEATNKSPSDRSRPAGGGRKAHTTVVERQEPARKRLRQARNPLSVETTRPVAVERPTLSSLKARTSQKTAEATKKFASDRSHPAGGSRKGGTTPVGKARTRQKAAEVTKKSASDRNYPAGADREGDRSTSLAAIGDGRSGHQLVAAGYVGDDSRSSHRWGTISSLTTHV